MVHTPPSSSSSPPAAGDGPSPAPAVVMSTSWSHVETVNLIEAYREKWYMLNRGQLRAHQWEEVAQSVAARCGFDPPSKTATQCRHKIEKLRKRYRVEKQRGQASAAAWLYFRHMDHMERGQAFDAPRPRPPPASPSSSSEEEEDDADNNNTRSISHILSRPLLVENSFPRFSRNPRFRKRSFREDREEAEAEPTQRREPVSELAAMIRSFGEGFARMEKMKMEMMREMEKNRMEMERKRTEVILESQMRIAEAIKSVILSQKRAKRVEEDADVLS